LIGLTHQAYQKFKGVAMYNQQLTVSASAVRAATNSSVVYENTQPKSYRGLHLVFDITVAPGVDTVTLKIEGYDTTSGKYYDILVGAALSTVGTNTMRVYPSQVAAANVAVSDCLPSAWRVTVTHSAATNFTYSVGATLLG